jgi:hypothetical protein
LYVLKWNNERRQLTGTQAKTVDEHPVVWLGFEEDCILTTCEKGESTNFLTASQHGYQASHVPPKMCAEACPRATLRNTRPVSHLDPQFAFVELELFVEADKEVDR